MHVYKVVATNDMFTSLSIRERAGTEIQPPLPLERDADLPTEQQWRFRTVLHGGHRLAVDGGNRPGRAIGPKTLTSCCIIGIRCNPAFIMAQRDQSPHDCVPWLDQGLTNAPVDVTYVIHWPTNSTYLEVGQTLTTPMNGLPDITDQLAAKIVYDDLNPSGAISVTNLARLYDPFSPRTLPVSPTTSWLSTLKLQNVSGVEQFSDLPYFLRIRLILRSREQRD